MSEHVYIVTQHMYNKTIGIHQVPVMKRTKSRVITTSCEGTRWRTTHYADQFNEAFSKTPEEAIARWRAFVSSQIEGHREEIKTLEAALVAEPSLSKN